MKTEPQIQFISVNPNELANLIAQSVKTQMQELLISSNKEQRKDEDDFLTRRETAQFFKVSLVTVHSWMKDGIIKPFKVGNRTYFKKSELVNVVESSNKF
jgi:hypothetical protein